MNNTTLKLLTALLAASILLPSTALAQDLPGDEPAATEAAKAPPTNPRKFDQFWAEKRQIRNIHKRLFLKDGRHEFTIYGGVIPNDEFWNYYPLGIRYDYYFSESLALEVSGSYIISERAALEEYLETEVVEGLKVELPQFLEWQAGAGVVWSPLHGKVSVFGSLLGHYDLGLAFGVMAIGTRLQKEGATEARPRVDVGANVGATVRFYVHDLIALRFDYRHYFYTARDADDNTRGISFPLELSIGVSFFTSPLE